MQELLDPRSVARGLRRIAGEILEKNRGSANLLLVGVRRGGIPVMRELARWIEELEGSVVRTGTVDITLYRDDAATALPNPRLGPSEMPHSIDGLRVVLIDDVAHTRRTTRAALDAVLDYGRPSAIELCVLIDREGSELPIQPDYWVKKVSGLGADERIDVVLGSEGLVAVVQPQSAPTLRPAALPPTASEPQS
jgi:pyrimidine operon attenuation protein/uracil phosphoribosyltransferase